MQAAASILSAQPDCSAGKWTTPLAGESHLLSSDASATTDTGSPALSRLACRMSVPLMSRP